MNKNKGFTLVEILAVLVIFSLIVVIVATSGFGAFDNAKEKIRLENEKILLKSAKTLGMEIENCDDELDKDIFTEELLKLNDEISGNCKSFQNKMQIENGCIKVTEGYLKTYGYVEGSSIDENSTKEFYICKENKKMNILNEGEHETVIAPGITPKPVGTCDDIPYDSNTLAYKIICDAKNAKDETTETIYRDIPLTTPGANSTEKYRKELIVEKTNTASVSSIGQSNYWTYDTSYYIHSSGKISLQNTKTCKYDDTNCLSDLLASGVNIYLPSSYITSNYRTDNELVSAKNLNSIVRLTSAPKASSDKTDITIEYEILKADPYNYESTLSKTVDDYGDSYYFRGGVKNNYLSFAGMCWRIVRVQGDGSVKLILEDQDETCSSSMDSNYSIGPSQYGFDNKSTNTQGYVIEKVNFLNPIANNDKVTIDKSFKNFQINELSDYLNKLEYGGWCFDTSGYSNSKGETLIDNDSYYKENKSVYYGPHTRVTMNNPSLKCNVNTLNSFNDGTKMYVGTLTSDEIIFAGGRGNTSNETYYLFDNNTIEWWTLSPHVFTDSPAGEDHIYHVNPSSGISCFMCAVGYSTGTRPSIVLESGALINSGNGTIISPYTIK